MNQERLPTEEIRFRAEIEKAWRQKDFNPYREIAYLESQILAHSILHDYEEADKYRNRVDYIRWGILFKMVGQN